MLGLFSLATSALLISPELTEFLPVGLGRLFNKFIDRSLSLVDNAVAPGLGPMMALN